MELKDAAESHLKQSSGRPPGLVWLPTQTISLSNHVFLCKCFQD